MNRTVLGVDGGNTKTIALIAAEDGTVLGQGRSGCSDIYGAGSPEVALDQLDLAIGSALESAGCRPDQLAASAFSMAGADWPEDHDYLLAALRARGFTRGLSIYNDAFAPLRAGSDSFTGVSVVCGTGAATGARSATGARWHASWWQDAQGARQLGHRALWAVIHAHLGIGPETGMTAGVLRAYDAQDVASLVHTMTARNGSGWAPEAAAPVLVSAAGAGDSVALQIAVAQGQALGEYALAAWRQVSVSPLDRLILDGTVLRRSREVSRAVAERVAAGHPEVRVIMPELDPVAGAVLLAMDRAQVHITEFTRMNLATGLAGEGNQLETTRSVTEFATQPRTA